MAERNGAPGKIGPSGETMQHGREGTPPRFFLEDARRVVVGVAGVNHQRQAGFARGRDMGAETALLRVAWRIIVMIVESGFAERDDLFFGASARRDRPSVTSLSSWA